MGWKLGNSIARAEGAIYTRRADAASQIDENKEVMPNLERAWTFSGRGLPARVLRAGIALPLRQQVMKWPLLNGTILYKTVETVGCVHISMPNTVNRAMLGLCFLSRQRRRKEIYFIRSIHGDGNSLT